MYFFLLQIKNHRHRGFKFFLQESTGTDSGNCKKYVIYGFDISTDTVQRYFSDFSSESSGESVLILLNDVRVRYRYRYGLTVFYWFVTNSTGELIPIPVIRKLVMGGSEKARLVPARIDGALAKWRRHYGEPKGLYGKSSLYLNLYNTLCIIIIQLGESIQQPG